MVVVYFIRSKFFTRVYHIPKSLCSDVCFFYERVIDAMVLGGSGIERDRAGKVAANLILQQCFKRANEKGVEVDQLGISPAHLAAIGVMREKGELNNQSLELMVDACLNEAEIRILHERAASDTMAVCFSLCARVVVELLPRGTTRIHNHHHLLSN